MSSVSDKIQHFEKLSVQQQEPAKRSSSSGSNNKRQQQQQQQPSTPKVDGSNRLLLRFGSGRTSTTTATITSPLANQPIMDASTRARRNPALLSSSSPSSSSSPTIVTQRVNLLSRTTPKKSNAAASGAPTPTLASSSSTSHSAKLFRDSTKESAYQSMLEKMSLVDNQKLESPITTSNPQTTVSDQQQNQQQHNAAAAGLPSSTFSENKVVDTETNKVLLLSSSSPMPDVAKRKRLAASQSPDPDHPSNSRKKISLFKSTKSQSPQLAVETNNIIPRWATPSPASAQKREIGGGTGTGAAGGKEDDESSKYYYSPAEGGIFSAKNINGNGNDDLPFKQHFFGEEPDPCPPEMLMEMVLRSVVFPQNEIKMKRQLALWECYERKMATGSFLDAPFANEYSS